jgi:hypothetical protein
MSRRMGPGGRLRPSPRAHRNLPRPDGARPSSFGGAASVGGGGSSAGVLGTGDDELLDDRGPGAPHHLAHLADFDVDDETMSAEVAGTVMGPELDVEPEPDVAPVLETHPPMPAPVQHHAGGTRGDRRPAGPGPNSGLSMNGRPGGERQDRATPSCTAPQLRRFIKSRAYVPMHELRRRFGINGDDDDVTGLDLESGRIYVGLPPQEGQLLGDLLRGGEVGFELSMDPRTPIVVGVYAMRPVPRP